MLVVAGVVGAALAGVMAGEAGVRRSGLLAIPLFVADPVARYRQKPSQQGAFRGRNIWRHDCNGMRVDGDIACLAGRDVIVGDSVVDGGNHVSQADTIAARLTAATGHPVYPVACPGWALDNELAALEALPEWREARRLIFVLNTGDFDVTARLGDPFSFPTSYPRFALVWLLRRVAARRFPAVFGRPHEQADPHCRARNLDRFGQLAKAFGREIVIVRYPMKDQDLTREAYFDALAQTSPNVRVIDLANAAGWDARCYRDHIHPTAGGLAVLCNFIRKEIS
jgi:hypothetical protein